MEASGTLNEAAAAVNCALETQLTRETAHVSEESQASNLATTESKGSTDTSKNKESEASEVPQDVMLQKSISEDNESGDSVPHNTVQVNEEKIDSGKNTVPKTEQPNKDLNQIELNHENCSGQNDPDQKETAVSTDEIGQEITPEATQNYESSTESCKTDKEENVIIANGNLEKPIESSTAGSPSHKTDTIAAPLEDKSVQTPIVDPNTNKKIKKKDKSTAEEKKLVDLLVHVFDGLETPDKKMEALAKKYIQLAADMKATENKLEDFEGKNKDIKREKEQLLADFGKVNMAKSKLESLCRELQKQNKLIKDEIQRRADEEDRKRRDLSQKFQSTINDITTQMGENHKRNQQLKQDNTDLAQKLKGLVEQYEVREQHIEKVLKAKQLELQLCEAKLQQQTIILQEERQNNLKEKHALLKESLEQEKKVEMLVKQEAELKGQLSLYTEKFVEFQSTLTKSNEVFATFKKEMDKMTKTIRKLEKESNTWKSRYENTNVSLIQMVEERTQRDNEIMTQKGKIEKLEKLCRALQAERRKLKKELEANDKTDNPSDKASLGSNPQDEAKSSESTPEPPEIDLEDNQQCNKSIDSSARQAPAGCDTEVTDKEEAVTNDEALVEKEANVVAHVEGKAEEQSSCA